MRIKTPPSVAEAEAELSAEQLIALLAQHSASDSKYLHYDQLRRRINDRAECSRAWAALKIKRATTCTAFSLAGTSASFNLTPAIIATLSLVDKMAFGTGREPSAQDASTYLASQLVMEEAISSSQLEGAATTSRVAMELLAVGRQPRNVSESMIMGNWRLMNHILLMADDPLSTDDILDIHAIACSGINDEKYRPGSLRDNNAVFVAGREGEIVHRPPDFTRVEPILDALCSLTIQLEQRDIHPLIVACILHFSVGYIHPFNDGNGRTARGLFYLHMIRRGYSAFRYMSISKLLKNAPVQYGMSYLYSETDEMDLTYFIQYQCQIISRAVNEFAASIERLHQERLELAEFVLSTPELDKTGQDILALALNAPGSLLSAAGVSQRLSLSDNTARSRLKTLAARGLLRALKDGRGLVYQAPASVAKLKQWMGVQG